MSLNAFLWLRCSYPAVCEFLQSNNLLSIIRAHEAQDAGYVTTQLSRAHKHRTNPRLQYSFFVSLPLRDHLEATGCIVKVRPLDSRPSLPSSQHRTTWMFTTTKVRNSLWIFYTHLWGLICCSVICFRLPLCDYVAEANSKAWCCQWETSQLQYFSSACISRLSSHLG